MTDILWIASYPKSGNTWVRAFLHNYLLRTTEPQDVNNLQHNYRDAAFNWYEPHTEKRKPGNLNPAEVMALRSKVQRDLAATMDGSVLVKTHVPRIKYLGHDLIDAKLTAGALYVTRNPLDICVSLAKFWNWGIDRTIEAMAAKDFGGNPISTLVHDHIGTWSEHVFSWMTWNHPGFIATRYEDLLDDPNMWFGRLAGFLEGGQPDMARVKKAVGFSSFDTLKSMEEKDGFGEASAKDRPFFRQGRAGGWREVLSTAQVDKVVAAHGETMGNFGYLP